MRQEFRLDAFNNQVSVNLPFVADGISIINSSPYTLLVRIGGNDIPTSTNADFAVSAGASISLPMSTRDFGFALTSPTGLTALVGLPCLIRLSVGEPLASFGSSNFRTQFDVNFSIVLGASFQQVIETSGALGLLIGVIVTSSPNGVIVNIENSADGSNFNPLDNYVASTTTSLQIMLPVTTRYYRVTISNIAPLTDTSVGVFSYSLTNIYSAIPENYRTQIVSTTTPSIGNNTLQVGNLTSGSGLVKWINAHLRVPSATPNAMRVILRAVTDGRNNNYEFNATPAVLSVNTIQLGIGLQYLTHRRLNEYAYRIPVDIEFSTTFQLSIENQSGGTITNVSFGYEVNRAI